MLAHLDAVVAVDANGVVPHNLAVSHGQGVSWAWLDACLAGDAFHLGLGVVAVGAANVAAPAGRRRFGFLGHLPARRE